MAAGAGLLHAAASLYWALGGRVLLDTVGAWATDLAARDPGMTGIVLGVLAVVKALAATVPVLVEVRRVGHRRLWRAVSAVGGAFLVLYGGANVCAGTAVLLGWIRPSGGVDQRALVGHVLLWDPLFLIWGLALVASLVLTRKPTPLDSGRR